MTKTVSQTFDFSIRICWSVWWNFLMKYHEMTEGIKFDLNVDYNRRCGRCVSYLARLWCRLFTCMYGTRWCIWWVCYLCRTVWCECTTYECCLRATRYASTACFSKQQIHGCTYWCVDGFLISSAHTFRSLLYLPKLRLYELMHLC